MLSAIFSAIIIMLAFKFPEIIFGIIDASHTLKFYNPINLPSSSVTDPIGKVQEG